MARIISALRREHESIGNILDVLESEIAYVVEYQGRRRADYRLIWSAIDYFTDFPDLVHHPKEDLVYEQMRLLDPVAATRVGDIPAAHASLALGLHNLAEEVKAVMEDPARPRAALVDLARTFIRQYRRHVDLEEAVFFPAAERMLDETSWSDLDHRMTARLDPLIGGESGERFEALRRTIAAKVSAPEAQPAR
jgi:hemerythrin-like domain-containing protein